MDRNKIKELLRNTRNIKGKRLTKEELIASLKGIASLGKIEIKKEAFKPLSKEPESIKDIFNIRREDD